MRLASSSTFLLGRYKALNMKIKTLIFMLFLFGFSGALWAQDVTKSDLTEKEISYLKTRIENLEITQSETKQEISAVRNTIRNNGLVLVLFGIFCAWWAKKTGRNAWLWFFLGAIFHVFTGIALLSKTERSKRYNI